LQPDDADVRHALGRALLDVGRTEDAIAQLNEALRLNPNHAGARDGLDRIRRGGASAR
jgi:Flp pilus assembly protein TadD